MTKQHPTHSPDALAELVEDLIDAGIKQKKAIRIVGRLVTHRQSAEAVAEQLDDVVDFEAAIDGPIGTTLEAYDDRIILGAIRFVQGAVEAFRRDPVKVLARKRKNALAKQARKARQAKRKAARHA